jgi:glycosyltransferase involved in cell wall biosynthesis
MRDVIFVVVGEDNVHYGNDQRFLPKGMSFRDWVLQREAPDLDRFRFLGRVSREELANVLSLSDLHIYLTVPFVLSWSMLNAMSCGCVVLASDVAPVRELIEHERTGLLADFFDVDELSSRALEVLHDPEGFAHLGLAARHRIEQEYSLDCIFPQLEDLYERVASGWKPGVSGAGSSSGVRS